MKRQIGAFMTILFLLACSKKQNAPPLIPASNGSTLQLQGIAGSETGSAAAHSVFVDLSADKQNPIVRASWDLAFFSGSDFRVRINNTTAATAVVTHKNDLKDVGYADTAGLKILLNQASPSVNDFLLMDDIDGDLSKTVIPAIAASAAENKVVILSRGTGGAVAQRDFMKIKIIRNGNNGYQLQYAKLNEPGFKTLEVTKDSKYNFNYVSFDKGLVNVEPEKLNWDFKWTASIFSTHFGGGLVPYYFSDMVAINYLAGVQVVEKNFSTIQEAVAAYNNYPLTGLPAENFSAQRWKIGMGWRNTAAPGTTLQVGTLKNKWYIIKDPAGNAYKLKFVSFASEDGGTRGKPEIKYDRIR